MKSVKLECADENSALIFLFNGSLYCQVALRRVKTHVYNSVVSTTCLFCLSGVRHIVTPQVRLFSPSGSETERDDKAISYSRGSRCNHAISDLCGQE